MNLRRWAADRLARLAHRLDPNRLSAHPSPDGGWDITLGGIPLAHVRDGAVRS